VAKARAGTIDVFVVSLPVLVGVFVYGQFVVRPVAIFSWN
jgi:hypothetical protein